jgi:hypothetical protein
MTPQLTQSTAAEPPLSMRLSKGPASHHITSLYSIDESNTSASSQRQPTHRHDHRNDHEKRHRHTSHPPFSPTPSFWRRAESRRYAEILRGDGATRHEATATSEHR